MVYDFAVKISNIKNSDILVNGSLDSEMAEIHKKFSKPQDIKVLVIDTVLKNTVLIKSQVSVSSMPGYLDAELSAAIEVFKSYLEEVSSLLGGSINKSEGFYNNSRIFGKLYT